MKYFTESEFNQFDKMNPKLLEMLDQLREAYGYPIKLTSTYRGPDHPIEAKKQNQVSILMVPLLIFLV